MTLVSSPSKKVHKSVRVWHTYSFGSGPYYEVLCGPHYGAADAENKRSITWARVTCNRCLRLR